MIILTKKDFEDNVKKSKSLRSVALKIGHSKSGGSTTTIKKYIDLYNIDISHFISNNKNNFIKNNLKDILVENSTYKSTNHLKNRLYKEGLKKPVCEFCNQDENWNGKKMSLILDHINGINDDNRLENLRILCPNCNSTLPTHCVGNKKS